MEIQKVSLFVGPGGDSKSKLSPFMMESQEIMPKLKKYIPINSIRKSIVSTYTSNQGSSKRAKVVGRERMGRLF